MKITTWKAATAKGSCVHWCTNSTWPSKYFKCNETLGWIGQT